MSVAQQDADTGSAQDAQAGVVATVACRSQPQATAWKRLEGFWTLDPEKVVEVRNVYRLYVSRSSTRSRSHASSNRSSLSLSRSSL